MVQCFISGIYSLLFLVSWFLEATATECHCSVQFSSVAQSCPTLSDPMDCSSSVHGIFQARVLEWGAIAFSARPFRYDLNQIPYNYTMEVRKGFKGVDLIECLMNYGWRFVTLYRRQGSRLSPRKRNAKRLNGCLRRPYK